MRSLIAFALLVLLAACGSVTADAGAAAGAAGAGGAAGDSTSASGGRASAAGSGGDGAAGATGGGRAGDHGGSGGTIATGGVVGSGGATALCLGPGDVQGFAYNHGCDGGTTLPTACHANCELNSSHFVGCVNDSRVDGGIVTCHATCSDCP